MAAETVCIDCGFWTDDLIVVIQIQIYFGESIVNRRDIFRDKYVFFAFIPNFNAQVNIFSGIKAMMILLRDKTDDDSGIYGQRLGILHLAKTGFGLEGKPRKLAPMKAEEGLSKGYLLCKPCGPFGGCGS